MKTTKSTSSAPFSEADRTLLRAVLGEKSKTLRAVETKLVPALTGGDAGRFDASFHPIVELLRAATPKDLPRSDRWNFWDLQKRMTRIWAERGRTLGNHAELWKRLGPATRFASKFSSVPRIIEGYFRKTFTAKLAGFVRSAVENQTGSIRLDELPKLMAGGLEQGLVPPGQLGFGTPKVGPFVHFISTQCPDLEIRTTTSGLNYVVSRELFTDSEQVGKKASNQVAEDHREAINRLTLVRKARPDLVPPRRLESLDAPQLLEQGGWFERNGEARRASEFFEKAKIRAAISLDETSLDLAVASLERISRVVEVVAA